ncbi:MAG: neutral zinc metallopeptidase [Burkholderiales bacterium]
MRWESGRRSDNIEDIRGSGGGFGGRGVKIGGLGMVVMFIVALFLGVDPFALMSTVENVGGPPAAPSNQASRPAPGPGSTTTQPQDEQAQFVSVVLADTEDTWGQIFAAGGKRYRAPKLVMFSGMVQSACGMTSAAAGPFYCPADQKVYIDLDFFRELDRRFGAPGDFARAYVIAHEVGHHVQNLLGVAGQVQNLQARASERQSNALSVRMELQADCLAGVWGHHANKQRQLLEPGDAEEGLRAAAAIGDDTIQSRSTGYVRPESWTHGSSDMRVRWFKRGLESGRIEQCDTFQAAQL